MGGTNYPGKLGAGASVLDNYEDLTILNAIRQALIQLEKNVLEGELYLPLMSRVWARWTRLIASQLLFEAGDMVNIDGWTDDDLLDFLEEVGHIPLANWKQWEEACGWGHQEPDHPFYRSGSTKKMD